MAVLTPGQGGCRKICYDPGNSTRQLTFPDVILNLSPLFFVPVAHGVFGPFDELLPIVLIAVLAGLLAFTWWNGRKAPLPPDNPTPGELPVIDSPTPPSAENTTPDESHYSVK